MAQHPEPPNDRPEDKQPPTTWARVGEALRDSGGLTAARRKTFPGSEYLSAPSPGAVLRSIVADDPLELERRCTRRLADAALLLDRERLLSRVFAHVARAALQYAGDPPLDPWLHQQVELSIDELVIEDLEAAREGEPFPEDDTTRQTLAGALGVPAELARRAAWTLNAMPEAMRRDFHALVLRRDDLPRYARETHREPADVRRNVEFALRALATLRGPDSNGPRSLP